ncbi:MAG TPA: DegV family protein [Aggregatilineales bacterium]|nr:DegV family protein [Anaerolineales bacterium]HRE46523.1 DegV family protein [Aggregatilineales bacterium]
MSAPIQIVTDSAAQFLLPGFAADQGITIIPLELELGGRRYRDGVDIDAEMIARHVAATGEAPRLLPPSVETIAGVYANLYRESNRILSVHLSRAVHPMWEKAKSAAETLLGRCDIAVFDSHSLAAGQGWLTEAGVRLTRETNSLDDTVRELRKLIPHIYSIFCSERLDYLYRAGLLLESQAVLGNMLAIKPFLTLEDGELVVMEKARSKPQVVDKLIEFVTEFAAVEQLAVLRGASAAPEVMRSLAERMREEFSPTPYPILTASSVLASLLGTEAIGIMILERELGNRGGDYDDDFDGEDDE